VQRQTGCRASNRPQGGWGSGWRRWVLEGEFHTALLTPISEAVPLYLLPLPQKTFHSSVEKRKKKGSTGEENQKFPQGSWALSTSKPHGSCL